MVLREDDFRLIQAVCVRLHAEANAKAVLVIDKNGQPIAEAGETDSLDVTSLASLTAGNVAATGGIAKLLAEREFSGQFHEGKNVHVMIDLVTERLILLVLFDNRSSQGLVRLRLRRAHEELSRIAEAITRQEGSVPQRSIINEITDDDIEHLFRE